MPLYIAGGDVNWFSGSAGNGGGIGNILAGGGRLFGRVQPGLDGWR